jgi:hypothetical protein
MKISDAQTINKKNKLDSSSNQAVNPFWPKAQVLSSVIKGTPVNSKPAYDIFIEPK